VLPGAGRWADILRIIGRALDLGGASAVTIRGNSAVEVAWRADGTAHGATYEELDMARLREQAARMRQPTPAPPAGEREELLRTLGQELDAQKVQVVEVLERPGSYEVRGTSATGPVFRYYALTELRALSARRRALRGTQAPTGRGSAPKR